MLLLVGGLAAITATALLARRGVYGWEIDLFRAVNNLPGSLRMGLWVLNQYGTAVTIPIVTALALLFRRWLLALGLAISGVAVYVLSKVIKD